jgi:23S rRNA (uracil1939-C5)-methyltransferase
MIERVVSGIGRSGDGIVRLLNEALFVPFAVTGDEIMLDIHKATKRLDPEGVTLVRAGDIRMAPPCPHHGDLGRRGCGGCRMQVLTDEAYRLWKRNLVIEALARAGFESAIMEEIRVSPPYSRRRASLTAGRLGNRVTIGFVERGTHRIVDLRTCLILKPELFALIEPLRRLPLLQDRERADILLAWSNGAIDLLIERRRELSLTERETLAEFAQQHKLARISWRASARTDAEPVAHIGSVTARFGTALVTLPPGGFLQATAEGEAALVEAAMQALPQDGHTLDLFAGAGTFTFPAALRGTVHAVEGNEAGVKAIQAARQPNVSAEHRDLVRDPVTDFKNYTAALFDPPHIGAEAQARALARSDIPVIIGISCNPVSFTRDAALLAAGGYRLERLVPVDQFLWSAEVEMAGIFRK